MEMNKGNKDNKGYYVGLDMGTSSVGWAVADQQYNIVKKHGKALWGIRLFDEAKTAEDRRMHRMARRRLERRSRRIDLLQELFAQEICKKDPGFYERLNESGLYEEDKTIHQRNSLFNDVDFDDKAYHKNYPTIYHLRYALMTENKAFDVRLVYLAIHHILKHRGHFLFDSFQVDENGASGFEENFAALGKTLDRITGVSLDVRRSEEIKAVLKDKGLVIRDKVSKLLKSLDRSKDRSFKAMMTLAAGGTASLSDVFSDDKLKDFEKNKVNFSSAQFEETEPDIMAELGERYDLIAALHGLYNWSLLAELMGEHKYISEAKIGIYEKHKNDLKILKRVLKQNPDVYAQIFKEPGSKSNKNYSAYVGISKVKGKKAAIEKCSYEDFAKTLKSCLKELPDSKDKEYIDKELERGTFFAKSCI